MRLDTNLSWVSGGTNMSSPALTVFKGLKYRAYFRAVWAQEIEQVVYQLEVQWFEHQVLQSAS